MDGSIKDCISWYWQKNISNYICVIILLYSSHMKEKIPKQELTNPDLQIVTILLEQASNVFEVVAVDDSVVCSPVDTTEILDFTAIHLHPISEPDIVIDEIEEDLHGYILGAEFLTGE